MAASDNATKILGVLITGTTGTTSTNLVYSTSPTLITPALGTPSSGVATNLTGTASGLTAGSVTNATFTTALTINTGTLTLTANAANTSVLTIGAGAVSISGSNTGDQTNISGNAATVTTNANLTGVITSSGNATSIASQTGTGTKFVVDTSPAIITPTIASFTNATHNHTNAAGGGQLTDAALSSAITVSKGGTGLTTTTAYGVIHAGTTATGNFQNSGTPGTSGNVYTSTGPTSLPTWQAPAGGSFSSTAAPSGGPATSSTQTITHGLGRTPIIVRLHGYGAINGSTSSSTGSTSSGVWNASGNNCVYIAGTFNAGSVGVSTSSVFAIFLSNGGNLPNTGNGVVQNVTSTTFDIVWTITGSLAPGNTSFMWEAQ